MTHRAHEESVEGLNRLHEEQWKAIEETEKKVCVLSQYESDYAALQKRLETLPHKVTHDIMVPFGPLAFMPGQLVHTNEILVLLGDNWFAERSAKQACETIDRRIAGVQSSIKQLRDQMGLLMPRADFTRELKNLEEQHGEQFEIKEEYDAEVEAQWRVAHRQRLQAEKRSGPRQDSGVLCETSVDDASLWARLDELELQETSAGEIKKELHVDEPVKERHVHWDAALGRQDPTGSAESSSATSSDDEHEPRAPNIINFSHTSQHGRTEPSSSGTITSPADIYTGKLSGKLHGQSGTLPPEPHPQSILKPIPHNERETTNTAFADSVTECSDVSIAPMSVPTGRKLSKFKQQRISTTRR